MIKPLISIVIPVFNRVNLIKVALHSVYTQSYANWECIIVDDGSSDGTLEVLSHYTKKDSRFSYFQRDRHPKGAPTCRNIGLEKSKGDYIIFLDSDDYLLEFCLQNRVEYIQEHKDKDFLVFPMGIMKNGNIAKKEIFKDDKHLILFLSANLPWQTMCPIWKRSTLLELNGFSEGYPRFNDPELMIRALCKANVSYLVCEKSKYDTVFLPMPKNSETFKDKVYDSLKLFIPDISQLLKTSSNNKVYLANYLHLWFKYFYVPLGKSDIAQSFNLILLFYKNDVITLSKAMSLMIRLVLFVVTNVLLKKPIDKLTEKAFYN